MLKNTQDFYAGIASPLGFRDKKNHSRAVISRLQKGIYIVKIWLAGCSRVQEVQCVLDRAVTNDEICICFKPSVFAAPVLFPGRFVCPLTTGFLYLLVTYGETNQPSKHDPGQAYHRCQPRTGSHEESIDGQCLPGQSAEIKRGS
jgi:hypothetical protein